MKKKAISNVCKATAVGLAMGTMLVSNGIVANAQPKVMKDGTTFDAEYYAQKYADVAAVYGTDEASLFQHYTDYGRKENREAVKAPDKSTFDAEYYASANPDVAAVYGTASNSLYQHYLQFGKAEGRSAVAGAKAGAAASAPQTAAPAADAAAPAAEAAAPAPTLTSLSIPAATVKVEKGGGHDLSGSGSSIWTQTYDSGSKRTGAHIGWDGKLAETMAESTDAYGVTYRSYAFNDPAKNVQSAKDALASYMADIPDSPFTAFVKESGSEIVIATYPALFPNGMQGLQDYPETDLLAWSCFIVDGKLYILGADNTFDWLEGTPRPDLYIPQYLTRAFNSVAGMLK